MMFTTPCFVRVKDAEKRDKLLAWCENLGYTTSGFRFSMPQPVCYLFTSSDFVGRCGELAIGSLPAGAIDCGTDVELFKALAAINDDNCREQWFVSDCLLKFERLKGVVKTEHGKRCLCRGEWFKVLIDEARDIRAAWIGFRRPKSIAHCASAEEIIEHFKNRAK